MFVIIGIVVVIGAILGGYLLEHGQILVLMQPAELLIIGGAAVGTILIANPPSTLKRLLRGLLGVMGGDHKKEYYLDGLKMLNDVFVYARKNGMAKLETDVDEPEKSSLFEKHTVILRDRSALEFLCDTLRMVISGGVDPFELEQAMELDLEVRRREAREPIMALRVTADALPGLGIVAAVLGIVITMGALGGPPEEIGRKVAAALVGTFLGILLCYGVVGPAASRIDNIAEREAQFLEVLRAALVAFARGESPILAIEYARRSIPVEMRPPFTELEAAIRRDARIPSVPKPGGMEEPVAREARA
jgi:chemotaxis protein MotA